MGINSDKEHNQICAICKAGFFRKPSSKVSKSGLYFCSLEHRNEAMSTGLLPTLVKKSRVNYYRGSCALCTFPMRSSSPVKTTATHKECRLLYLVSQWLSGNNEITLVKSKKSGKPQYTKSFVKQYVIETRGDCCEECGYDESGPFGSIIQMDHINGNKFDNRLENLKLLCPNCHCKTVTWGSRNKTPSKK